MRIRRYTYSVLALTLFIATATQGMHYIKKARTHSIKPLNHIDRQLIVRHAMKIGMLPFLKRIHECEPTQYVTRGSKDIALLVPAKIFTFDTHLNPMHQTDTLTQTIFAQINAIEKRSGYRPETIQNLNGWFQCATNKLSENTQYWHHRADDGKWYVTCTTLLDHEHEHEIKILFQTPLAKNTL